MAKLTIDDLELEGKKVLMRVDFNVPLDKDRNITDDLRIQAALPSIRKIIEQGGQAILCSHLGRPKGKRLDEFSLAPVAKHLSKLLGKEVQFASDCTGEKVDEKKKNLQNGQVLLLENLRFHKGETSNDGNFAEKLASHCDLYINDAFGTAHRAHASTSRITEHFEKNAAGYLMQKELKYLGEALENPQHPFVTVLGGAKISGKIDVIENLLGKTDTLLIGGGMIFTFFKAQGKEIGQSLLEEDRVAMAGEIMAKVEKSTTQMLLPEDVVISKILDKGAQTQTVEAGQIPANMKGGDIGEKTIASFKDALSLAKTVVWNGPLGVFETSEFAEGTEKIARYLAEITDKGAITIIGGGDSAAAVKKFGLTARMTHVSTGGGASLEFLEGKTLPGVAALSDK